MPDSPGRPKLPPDYKRCNWTLRCSAWERNEWQEAADKAGQPLVVWARNQLNVAARAKGSGAPGSTSETATDRT